MQCTDSVPLTPAPISLGDAWAVCLALKKRGLQVQTEECREEMWQVALTRGPVSQPRFAERRWWRRAVASRDLASTLTWTSESSLSAGDSEGSLSPSEETGEWQFGGPEPDWDILIFSVFCSTSKHAAPQGVNTTSLPHSDAGKLH